MNEKEILSIHDEILNYFLKYKKEHNDFTFSPRKNHNNHNDDISKCRLCNRYWFQGAGNYIFVALYNRGCKDNKTKTIGFVVTEDKQYIEIVYKNVDGITAEEERLYEELINYLRNSNEIKEVEKKNNRRQFCAFFKNNNLENNLDFFISSFKLKSDELIKRYSLENKFFVSPEELDKRLLEINQIKKNFNNNIFSEEKQFTRKNIPEETMKIKNIILYGAPGVGKTHNYKNLIAMIENGKSQNEVFETISQNLHVELENDTFEKIKEEKRVEFVSFHQSYSYEDFIEGFRPNENGNIELEDGIFKLISEKALKNIKEKEYKHISFDEAYDIFREQYLNGELEVIKTVSNATIFIQEFKERFIKAQTENAKDIQHIKKSDLETVVNGLLSGEVTRPADVKKLDVKKDTHSLAGYYFPFSKIIAEIMKENKLEKEIQKNFYIVIDEINRGNISKIFGELITLIEEDKRDKYEVKLPYSKESFKVPSNLYIIATMNSTDKSIATIDIALRRRFTFLKMRPNEDLVKNEQANIFMHKANKYIKEKKGEDYILGHSYFMQVTCKEDLDFVKEYKIKPLLEEYFYVEEKNADDILEEIEKVEMKENNE